MQEYSKQFDTVIIGSGLAGLNLARKLADAGQKVFICSKHAVTEANSKYAQGGIAVVSPLNPEDKIESHIQDTLDAAQGLANEELVSEILTKAWQEVSSLIELGLKFDEGFNLEGSHSFSRILHVGDATGRAVMKPLLDKVSRDLNIYISQGYEAMSLIKDKESAAVIGVSLQTLSGQNMEDINQEVMTTEVWANNIVLATGGLCGLYQESTNSETITGDGIALAYDAGAKIENLEFVQFHPTVYKSKSAKNYLVTEALRGAGAQLRNSKRELFAENYHPEAEMATRDIVSRAIVAEMRKTDSEFVYIDATMLAKETLEQKFPNLYNYCLADGIDISKDLLPVRPAAHYSIGGIKTDIAGRTNVQGLYAIGEVASNGLHGANRLASNSLLECIVVPEFASQAILEQTSSEADLRLEKTIDQMQSQIDYDYGDDQIEYCSDYSLTNVYAEQVKEGETLELIKQVISKNLGIERREKSMRSTIKYLEDFAESKAKTVALLLAKSALQRKESRGVHNRIDSPKQLKSYARSTILSRDAIAIRDSDSDKVRRIIQRTAS